MQDWPTPLLQDISASQLQVLLFFYAILSLSLSLSLSSASTLGGEHPLPEPVACEKDIHALHLKGLAAMGANHRFLLCRAGARPLSAFGGRKEAVKLVVRKAVVGIGIRGLGDADKV